MTPQETAYKKIAELVQRFEEQIASYKKSEYNETQTRKDFIDPFFKALGWDVDNENSYAEAYREVIHEDKIRIGKTTKAPDYSFKLSGGKRLFFVEAKKPSVFVKEDTGPAFQVRRYGWNCKLAISIITDFEEFTVYDCTKKPNQKDKAQIARIEYFTFRDYLNKFDFIWQTFSKEAVQKGGFDNYIKSDTYKKGTATVDKEFLKSLDDWRTYLATSIALNNKNLNEDEINFVVQQTIDRIIFLRIAEARLIEPENNLKSCLDAKTEGDYYKNLFRLFEQADDKYNSGLFDFNKDTLSAKLTIDNKVIKNIVSELYLPESIYEFSVMPVEILGSAYEQFLGKVIRITPAHNAKIEEKPEVRKAGGVYYTPQYIVDYIVEHTVGKLIGSPLKGGMGMSPKEVSKIKIVDPACGSGSFLLGAYQYLLDWHKKYYQDSVPPTKRKGIKTDVLTPNGDLTTAIKKEILLNNIYGVDIDVNAVEVTKLSLLLKCMEGETEASINHQLKMFHERILPSLENNIKCGNSLIDTDVYKSLFNLSDEKKIKPFNWQVEFPSIFKTKKSKDNFDFKNQFQKIKTISNETDGLISKYILKEPDVSYSKEQDFGGFDIVIGNPPYGAELSTDIQNYCLNKYFVGNTDTAALFLVQAKRLLKQNGLCGFIIPKSFTFASNWKKTRDVVLNDLTHIVDCGKVWKEVKLEMSIIISQNESDNKSFNSLIIEKEKFKYTAIITKNICREFDFILNGIREEEIQTGIKLKRNHQALNDVVTNQRGAMLQKNICEKGNLIVIGGKQIKRYSYNSDIKGKINSKLVIDQKAFIKQNSVLVQNIVAHIQNPYPHIQIIGSLGNIFEKNTVIIDTVNQLECKPNINNKVVLAILSSTLCNWYTYKFIFANAIRTMHFDSTTTEKIPFPKKIDHKLAIEITKYVDELFSLNQEIQITKLESRIDQIKRKIKHCEDQINLAVYKLYELSKEEIEIVEGR